MNTSRPSEHPPVRGKNFKMFRWDHGCKDKTSSWHINGSPYGIKVTLGQQYNNVGEKPNVILSTYYLH